MADECIKLDCNYVDWDNVVGPWIDPNDTSLGRDYSLGHISDLLNIAVTQLGNAKGKGQLTNAEMGAAYAAIIPAAFREAINYELAEALAETNIQNAGMDIELKQAQLIADRNKTEAELEKHWGYDVTRDPVDDTLILGASTDLGKIDEEVESIKAGTDLTVQKIAEVVATTALAEQKIVGRKQ